MYILLIMMIVMPTCVQSANREATPIEITELLPEHVNQAKNILYHISYEYQFVPYASVQDAANILGLTDICKDYDHATEHYFNNRGTFLVALADQQVIGTGAIRYFDDTACELKRLYFLPEYRGKGLATALMQQLIARARHYGYQKMLLEVYRPKIQTDAISFYTKLGFHEIPPYRQSSAQLWMEMSLSAINLP